MSEIPKKATAGEIMQWYKDHPRDLEAVQKSIREGLASCLPNHPGINYIEAIETTLLWRDVQIGDLRDEQRKLQEKVDKLQSLLQEIKGIAVHAPGYKRAYLVQSLQSIMGLCEEADSEQEAN